MCMLRCMSYSIDLRGNIGLLRICGWSGICSCMWMWMENLDDDVIGGLTDIKKKMTKLGGLK